MTDQLVRTQVLRLYRINRATMNPSQAMAATRCAFADSIARDICYRESTISSHDQRAWEYADMLCDMIAARCGRGLYAGRYWSIGVLTPTPGMFRLEVYIGGGQMVVQHCRSLACAIRRGLSLLRHSPGRSFTVTDRRGRVYVEQATELSTMGELFDRAKVSR